MVINKYLTPNKSTSSLRRDLDTLFDSLFNTPSVMSNSEESLNAQWAPSVDIKETPKEYKVLAELPGVNPKDIKVSLDKNILTIQGEKTVSEEKDDSNWHRVERFSGSFCRRFTMPSNIDSDKIKAKTKHGILELTIPKIEKSEAKFVNVESDE